MTSHSTSQSVSPQYRSSHSQLMKVAVIVDQPNSTTVDLKKLSRYAYNRDPFCRLYLVFRLNTSERYLRFAESQGYRLILSTKGDVDHLVRDLIDDEMDRRRPPTLLIVGSGDRDYVSGIKMVLRDYPSVVVKIAVGTQEVSNLYRKLGIEILSFPFRYLRSVNR